MATLSAPPNVNYQRLGDERQLRFVQDTLQLCSGFESGV